MADPAFNRVPIDVVSVHAELFLGNAVGDGSHELAAVAFIVKDLSPEVLTIVQHHPV